MFKKMKLRRSFSYASLLRTRFSLFVRKLKVALGQLLGSALDGPPPLLA